VDLSNPASYAAGHIPGAIHLDYADLIRVEPPAMGLLPDEAWLGEVCSRLGLTPKRHVVAYDDEGNGRAGRLLWTLAVLGHESVFAAERRPPCLGCQRRTAGGAGPSPVTRRLFGPFRQPGGGGRQSLHPGAARTRRPGPARYPHPDRIRRPGPTRRSRRPYPGAVNLNWIDAMDPQRQLRLLPDSTLRELLATRGVTPDKEVIVYCQTSPPFGAYLLGVAPSGLSASTRLSRRLVGMG
jgi:thiosulfate/3-mercaptopyruvate sulfurtransferase